MPDTQSDYNKSLLNAGKQIMRYDDRSKVMDLKKMGNKPNTKSFIYEIGG